MNTLILEQSALAALIARVLGVVPKKSSLPILSNLLIETQGDTLTITGSDLETELSASVALPEPPHDEIHVTVPAHKLAQIARAAAPGMVKLALDEARLTVRAGRSRWSLATLPACDYPRFSEPADSALAMRLPGSVLRDAIKKTAFAAGKDDVRFYLNGLNVELTGNTLNVVATDGHRLATHALPYPDAPDQPGNWIVPAKTTHLIDSLLDPDTECGLLLTRSSLRLDLGDTMLRSKLIDGRYPDWRRVIPRDQAHSIQITAAHLRAAIQRTAILSNGEFQGLTATFSPDALTLETRNTEHEEASETLDLQNTTLTGDESISIGFNLRYMLDALSAIDSDDANIHFTDNSSAFTITPCSDSESIYVVMPMRL